MDEPLSNLDAKLRESMRTQIKQLQRELHTTIVYVTHDQTEAMTMGDRIALLNEGEIQQIGQPLELYNKPKNLFVASFIGTPKINVFRLVVNGNQLNNHDMSIVFGKPANKLSAQELYLAVRPEHLSLTQDKDLANLIGQVLNVEQLGSETLVTLNIDAQSFRAKLQGQLMMEPGETIYLIAKQSKLHYFDVESEARLEFDSKETS
ncbi:glycerol-3-phosphate ABC transporter ATP-binding protein [Lactococcus termiticola]|uniref:Glycerol-3-phosphate ABC transporter ATP-binding protein n=2 Tax=Lactococcus termiticola TaxID=2169526 RepID=A0A2R5HHE6_9LACT|nr:glycerol-3-phosphate ABC transporter ATP-binding protein [Lactococcus termiticola]